MDLLNFQIIYVEFLNQIFFELKFRSKLLKINIQSKMTTKNIYCGKFNTTKGNIFS